MSPFKKSKFRATFPGPAFGREIFQAFQINFKDSDLDNPEDEAEQAKKRDPLHLTELKEFRKRVKDTMFLVMKGEISTLIYIFVFFCFCSRG